MQPSTFLVIMATDVIVTVNNLKYLHSFIKMSRLGNKKVDKRDLYNELQSAVEGDKLYWVRNDAKIRAVVNSRSYDEFRDIVAAAHLTPLDKNDMNNKAKSYTWNKMVKKPIE